MRRAATPEMEDDEDVEYRDTVLWKEASTDSLGLSQASDWGDEDRDMCDLISMLPPTQPAGDNSPPESATSSGASLGKRKASDESVPQSSGSASIDSRPGKVPKISKADEEENTFWSSKRTAPAPAPASPKAPICFSSQPHHRLFENIKMPYGVQYEIARYVSLGKTTYGQLDFGVLKELAKLSTNDKAAPATLKMMLKKTTDVADADEDTDRWKYLFAKEQAAKSPWKELDSEEDALKRSPYGGLGFNDKGEHINWHGGKVLFHGKLHDSARKKTPDFSIKLEAAALGPSNMFARRFGSKNCFRLRLPKNISNRKPEDVLAYLKRPIIMCGGVFRAYYSKENVVFYFRTNEATDGEKLLPGQQVEGMSLLEFVNWHNSLQHNSGQKMAKWVSRIALGLSNSVPGLMLDRSNIEFIDDIMSETGSNMTDGAGKINRWSLKQIRLRLDLEDKPTAIQVRVLGAKGLLIDDGRNADEFGHVKLTPSQRKIAFPESEATDPAHRIVDVLRTSHTKAPCRLSVETIINLAENGVPKSAFLDLLRQSLKELVDPLLDWDSEDAMINLWCTVRRLGGVMAARRAREEAGLARVKGHSERDTEEIELEDEDALADFDIAEQAQRSSAWWNDEVSGCPSSLEETIMCMLDSTLIPQECPILREKLQKFVKCRVKEYIKNYRIDVPMSASAFLVPDTDGVLAEGEVFFKSSRREFRNEDGTETDIYIGDVLVTRHPCKLPTDVQKWKSVDRPELHYKVDVIVFSTKGLRRAADWLSGGDYDGDKGTYIYQPELVIPFRNADPKFADPPANIEEYFASGPTGDHDNLPRRDEEVVDFIARTKPLSKEDCIRELQNHLLGSIRTSSVVGKYSNYHDMAIYTLGYDHPETIRLANMFCMVLDGVKTGKTVSPQTLENDIAKYNKRPPVWKETEEEKERYQSSNVKNTTRPRNLSRFIMDDLHKQADDEGDIWLARIDKRFDEVRDNKRDEVLARPWERAVELAKKFEANEKSSRLMDDLEKLKKHVEEAYSIHRNVIGSFSNQPSPKKGSRSPSKKGSFTEQPIEVRQDIIRKMSKDFVAYPPSEEFYMSDEEVARVRASYAYVFDHKKRPSGTRFPWDLAMRELGAIKAGATGRPKTVGPEFYSHFNMKHPKRHHS